MFVNDLTASLLDLWTDDRDIEDEGRGTIVFMYVLTFLFLLVIGIFGNRWYSQGHSESLLWMFFSFVSYSFAVMVLVGGLGAIKNEEHEIEETGWYGQVSVLLFLTCLIGMVKSMIFLCWLSYNTRFCQAHKEDSPQKFDLMADSVIDSDYV